MKDDTTPLSPRLGITRSFAVEPEKIVGAAKKFARLIGALQRALGILIGSLLRWFLSKGTIGEIIKELAPPLDTVELAPETPPAPQADANVKKAEDVVRRTAAILNEVGPKLTIEENMRRYQLVKDDCEFGLKVIEGSTDPGHVTLCLQINLAIALCELSRFSEAAALCERILGDSGAPAQIRALAANTFALSRLAELRNQHLSQRDSDVLRPIESSLALAREHLTAAPVFDSHLKLLDLLLRLKLLAWADGLVETIVVYRRDIEKKNPGALDEFADANEWPETFAKRYPRIARCKKIVAHLLRGLLLAAFAFVLPFATAKEGAVVTLGASVQSLCAATIRPCTGYAGRDIAIESVSKSDIRLVSHMAATIGPRLSYLESTPATPDLIGAIKALPGRRTLEARSDDPASLGLRTGYADGVVATPFTSESNIRLVSHMAATIGAR